MANLVSEQELFFTAFEPKTVNRYVMYVEGVPASSPAPISAQQLE